MRHDHRKSSIDFHRRGLLLALGSTMLAGNAAAQAAQRTRRPECVVTPAQTEGPFFIDEQLNRSDIRSDPADGSIKAGVPLALLLRVHAIDGTQCAPLAGAVVDVWHCDAAGMYSGVDAGNTGGKKFLRGFQTAGDSGAVQFVTIYPGHYPGRAVHIHFKVRTPQAYGRAHEFTSQLYFDDTVTGRVHANPPYAARPGRATPNERDGLFRHGGRQLMVALAPAGQGYAATFDIALRMA